MKKKNKQPKMDYASKMAKTVLQVMEISDKNKYKELIDKIKILIEKPHNDEIEKCKDIMDCLSNDKLFCDLACGIIGDALKDLPQFNIK